MRYRVLLVLIACTALAAGQSQSSADREASLQNRIESNRLELEQLQQPPALPKTPRLDDLDDDQTLSAAKPEHQPNKTAIKAVVKAERLAKKGRYQDAIEAYRQALAADPLLYQVGNNLAVAYLNAGQVESAIQQWTQLTKQFPEHVLFYNNLAGTLLQLKRYKQAEAVAREALFHHPLSFRANLLLGEAMLAQGRWTPEAKQSLTFASATRPEAKTLLARWPVPSRQASR